MRVMTRQALLVLAVGGGFAVSNADAAEANDPTRIKALAEQAATGDWTARTAAIDSLREEHGGHSVAGLLRYVGSQADVDSRVQGVYALRRLGPAAVPALIAALHSDDAMVRRNVCMALGAMGDRRASAALAGVAQNDADPLAQEQAVEALAELGGGGADFVELAKQFRTGGGDAGDTVFFWNGKKVMAAETGEALAGAAYAKLFAEDALRANPADEAAQAELVAAYDAMHAAIAEDEESDWADRLGAIEDLLALGGSLQGTDSKEAPTFEAVGGASQLLDSDDKRLRYRAALSLSATDRSSRVVSVLADALSESAVRQILVVADDPAELNRLVAMLRTRESYAVGATTGAMGLIRAKSTPVKDVVVVSSSISDLPLDRFVGNLHRDARTKDVPVIVLAQESEVGRLEDQLGSDVLAVVPGTITMPVLKPSLDAAFEAATLNDQRMQAEQFSRQAADALAAMDGGALAPATEALLLAIGREDAVQVPALHALAKIGPASAQELALGVFQDADASTEARVAAADALGGALARHPASIDTLKALEAALAGSDADIRSAAARALGRASLSPVERTHLLLANAVEF